MKLNQKVFLAVVLVIGIMLWNSFSQEGVGDLEGGFEEMAFYRNENNTGPIKRVYIVNVQDTLWQEMQAYGDFQLYTKFGNTQVYYFLKGSPIPNEVNGNAPYFDALFNEYCIAKYEKNNSGLVSFEKYPFGMSLRRKND